MVCIYWENPDTIIFGSRLQIDVLKLNLWVYF